MNDLPRYYVAPGSAKPHPQGQFYSVASVDGREANRDALSGASMLGLLVMLIAAAAVGFAVGAYYF